LFPLFHKILSVTLPSGKAPTFVCLDQTSY